MPREIWKAWEGCLQGHERVGTILLDIDDEIGVESLVRVLNHHAEWRHLLSLWLKEISLLREEKVRLYRNDMEEDWDVVRRRLQAKWISDNAKKTASDSHHTGPRPKMPDFLRAISLRAFPDNQYREDVKQYGEGSFMHFNATKGPACQPPKSIERT
jgi:hypothetical protein